MNVRATVLDLGVGNLHSLEKAFEGQGAEVLVTSSPERALDGDLLVLPGVGAFDPAAQALGAERNRIRTALENGFPCLGICLGMQLLFEESEEGRESGLGVIPGKVVRLEADRVPHMGWNDVAPSGDESEVPISPGLAYFANSFVAEPRIPSSVRATTTYGAVTFPSVVSRGSTWGVQFHPEKSGAWGIDLIRRFVARNPRIASGPRDEGLPGHRSERGRRRSVGRWQSSTGEVARAQCSSCCAPMGGGGVS